MDEQPVALVVEERKIPGELRGRPQWVVWKYRRRGERWDKVPFDPRTGATAKVDDPGTWCTYEVAIRAYRTGDYAGIGFVLDEGGQYTFADLDHCRDAATGKVEPWAKAVISRLNSYTEVSPSGTGVKIVVKGRLPDGSIKRREDIEIYATGRYMAVTGRHLPGTPKVVHDRQDVLLDLVADLEALGRAMAARNKATFRALWAGDNPGHRSDSEGDLALCRHLAYWADGDAERVDRLFALSVRGGRKKWLERQDYRESTIEAAIEHWAMARQEGGGTTSALRIIQGQSGENTPADVLSADEPARQAVPPIGQPPFENSGMWLGQGGYGVVEELARRRRDDPDHVLAFDLARKLRGVPGGQPEHFEEVVRKLGEEAGRAFEDLWYDFLLAWDIVLYPEGEGPFEWAIAKARSNPIEVSPCLSADYRLVASIAYYLAQARGETAFFLPVERIAGVLGKSIKTASKVIRLVRRYGLIRCVCEGRYSEGKANEYAWLGGHPSMHLPAPAVAAQLA